MPIHFSCPHCGVATDIDDRFAGETGPCAHCGKAITVPKIIGLQQRGKNAYVPSTLFLIVAALCVVALAVLGGIHVTRSKARTALEAALRMQCVHNLQRIASAMREYEAANGCFPPAFVADAQGRPMHSWRVLLLPYLGQQELYDRYRFSEPWNSPHNRAVCDRALAIYQCPARPDAWEPTTNYLMVVGPNTISNGREGRKIAEITDGLDNTILLVEAADSNIGWGEPKDLRFDRIGWTVNDDKRENIGSYHPEGANVVFCDGSVRLLKNTTPSGLLRAMTTIDGGEPHEPPN